MLFSILVHVSTKDNRSLCGWSGAKNIVPQYFTVKCCETSNKLNKFRGLTFVSKTLWYTTFKKNKNKNKKKTRLLPDLKPSQNVPQQSLIKVCKFHEKINDWGQNVLYNKIYM